MVLLCAIYIQSILCIAHNSTMIYQMMLPASGTFSKIFAGSSDCTVMLSENRWLISHRFSDNMTVQSDEPAKILEKVPEAGSII